jgi:hypothetical protein
MIYRKYINIVEAANKGCPIATHDIDVNLKNRQKAIDSYHYGPVNPDEPEAYWKDAAKLRPRRCRWWRRTYYLGTK